jgi:hypothetical protein
MKTTLGLMALAALATGLSPAAAQVSLGSAQNFAVLGATTVSNTGVSAVTGNVGLSPGTAVTGFPPGVVVGTVHVADALAEQAQEGALAAYDALAGIPLDVDLTGQDLGGRTLVPGVYRFTTSAELTGALQLDAGGNDAAVFVFQIGGALTTASGASVTLTHGGRSGNVFWQVGGSATLGSSTTFVGSVLASSSITLTTGASVAGRVMSLRGAVTMDSNGITLPDQCQCMPALVAANGSLRDDPAEPIGPGDHAAGLTSRCGCIARDVNIPAVRSDPR